jgi:hypothetical protein
MKITINGHQVEADSPLTFEGAVAAGLWGPEDSVTYRGPRRGDARRSGILSAGKSVELEEGMHFSTAFTGGA